MLISPVSSSPHQDFCRSGPAPLNYCHLLPLSLLPILPHWQFGVTWAIFSQTSTPPQQTTAGSASAKGVRAALGCTRAPNAIPFTAEPAGHWHHPSRAAIRRHMLCSRESAPVGSTGMNPFGMIVLQTILFPCTLWSSVGERSRRGVSCGNWGPRLGRRLVRGQKM